MDEFTQGYFEAALWSENDDNSDPIDRNYWFADLSDECIEVMVADCRNFQEKNKELLKKCGGDPQNGHDFLLTRNGHGAGFWDRDYGQTGEDISKVCEKWGEFHLYVEDGCIFNC